MDGLLLTIRFYGPFFVTGGLGAVATVESRLDQTPAKVNFVWRALDSTGTN